MSTQVYDSKEILNPAATAAATFKIGHFCPFVPQFGSMIHKTQDEPLSLMMSQFVSEFIS